MALLRSILLSIFLSLFFHLSVANFHSSKVSTDDQFIISFDEFTFTQTGRLQLNVSDIKFSDPNPDLDFSKIGFFLCTRDAWIQLFQQLEDGEINCVIHSNVIKPVYIFNSLGGENHFEKLYRENDANQYTLAFANCITGVQVSMTVRSAMYNLVGRVESRIYDFSTGKTTLSSWDLAQI